MSQLAYSHTLVAGTPEDVNDVQDMFNDVKNLVNGGLDNTNLSGTAGITDANLASPNNSAYRVLMTANSFTVADMAAATYVLFNGNAVTASPASVVSAPPPMIYFDDADYVVGGRTQKLRLRAQVLANATAWSSVTATFGLYPVTFAGGADTLVITLGTVVSGSTVAIANPSASTVNQGNSGDFTIPSDGQYVLGVVTSAALTNNAAAALVAQLQTRNT